MNDNAPNEELANFDKLWNFSDPVQTEKRFRQLAPAAVASGDISLQLQLRTQIARTQGLQNKFDDAHQSLDAVKEQLDEAAPVVKVRYLLERGRVLNSSGNQDKAKPLFLDAWTAAGEADEDFHAVDAAHMLGIIEPPQEALAWNEKALALAEKSKDEKARRWLGSLYNNIGWTYHNQNEFAKSLVFFEKAFLLCKEKGSAGPIRIARWGVARTLRLLDRVPEALEIQKAMLHEHEADGGKDGFVFEELAECYLHQDRAEDAKKYFTLAYEELSKDDWLVKHETERIERLKKLSGQ